MVRRPREGAVQELLDLSQYRRSGCKAVSRSPDAVGGKKSSGRQHTAAWRSLIAGLFVLTALSASGCSMLPPLLPSALLKPTYVANRDDYYFVGTRCASVSLIEVGVFADGADWSGPEVNFENADWQAVSDVGLREFELFTGAQPGAVVVDDGRVSLTSEVVVYTLGADGRSRHITTVLGDIGPGMVDTSTGIMSWEEYMNQRDDSYGCG